MGYKMKAKFDSTCKECGKATKEGEDIYYDKESKAVCQDMECYKKQGGSNIEFPKQGGGGYKQIPQRPVLERIEDVEVAVNWSVKKLQEVSKIIPLKESDYAIFIESLTKTIIGAR